MKIITFEDMQSLKISPVKMYGWVEEMLRQKYTAILPPKVKMNHVEGGRTNVMPCALPNIDAMGIKMNFRYPAPKPSLTSQILLCRLCDGTPLALMDGAYITWIRTGAVAAHSIVTFAKRGYETIGIMGLGNSAYATMNIFTSLDHGTKYLVRVLKYKDQAEAFIRRFEDCKNFTFSVCESAEEMIRTSDVTVSCITFTDTFIARDECFMPGCTIIPVHTRGFQNCDLFFDKVFGDDRGHVDGFKNFGKFKSFAETCDVVTGKAAGRTNVTERILVYNIGLSIHDIYFAHKVYEMLSDKLPDDVNLAPLSLGKLWV